MVVNKIYKKTQIKIMRKLVREANKDLKELSIHLATLKIKNIRTLVKIEDFLVDEILRVSNIRNKMNKELRNISHKAQNGK